MTELYPLLLEPALHVKVWGGRKLAEAMGKSLPTDEPFGESWEVHDTSTIDNGPLAGQTLGDILKQHGTDLIGPHGNPEEGLPLLVKLLDAADWLSVQVHPDDAQAAELEGEPRGKTEAWIILAAEPGAELVIGVLPGTERKVMAQAIRDNSLESLLVKAPVKAGNVLFIRAGTIHAIGPGILLYEIQQSSDTTYRLYDWGRMDLDGKPRPMHIDKGVQVSNLQTVPPITHPDSVEGLSAVEAGTVVMVESEFFVTTLHHLQAERAHEMDTGAQYFHALTCITGAARVQWRGLHVDIRKGQSVFIPAALGAYQLTGTGDVLISRQQ